MMGELSADQMVMKVIPGQTSLEVTFLLTAGVILADALATD